MGLVAQSTKVHSESTTQNVDRESIELSQQEIEALLNLIKKSTFIGQDVEVVYNLVVKLQKQYLHKTKQQ